MGTLTSPQWLVLIVQVRANPCIVTPEGTPPQAPCACLLLSAQQEQINEHVCLRG